MASHLQSLITVTLLDTQVIGLIGLPFSFKETEEHVFCFEEQFENDKVSRGTLKGIGRSFRSDRS